ncbi:hypothetical protein F4803DRAFT_572818 [Xylaria telfairii]|nr:hypothetical protein F4803DRAFT_572818 [Xylaria telfairii]
MNHGYSYSRSTDALWLSGTTFVGEILKDERFNGRLNQFKSDQDKKTPTPNFSIDVVILKRSVSLDTTSAVPSTTSAVRSLSGSTETMTEEPVQPSGRGTRHVSLSIKDNHFGGLVAAFGLSPSFERRRLPTAGYHDYVKDNSSIHDESQLIFAVRTPRLHNKDHFFAMKIEPHTGSTMCIIIVPNEDDRKWLWTKISDHHRRIMTCPVYLFYILCERLEYSNENLTSQVFDVFEEQEREMENSCGEAKPFDNGETNGRHPNESKIYNKHGSAIIELNKVNNKLMTLCCTTDFELSVLGFAKSVISRYNTLCTASPANNLPRMSDEELQDFNDKIESLETTTRLRQTMRASAQQRASHMVSLLRASNSQRDTIYNQQIAENGRKTSSQARNLTILGSLFLPPSFVATVFSASVFGLNSQTGHLDVANEWRILVAFSVGLTLLVIFIMAYIWLKEKPGQLKSCCPFSGSSKDATNSGKEFADV